jgi:predicted GNAT family acetyltransferase
MEKAMTANVGETDIDALQRLALNLDGCSVAVVEFYLFGKVAIVTHTEVDARHRGKGLGAVVASQALERFRSENRKVVPVCGFFLQHIRRHPEYTDLMTPHCRRIFAV